MPDTRLFLLAIQFRYPIEYYLSLRYGEMFYSQQEESQVGEPGTSIQERDQIIFGICCSGRVTPKQLGRMRGSIHIERYQEVEEVGWVI